MAASSKVKRSTPPVLHQLGTGVGKTSRIIPQLAQQGPLLVQVQTMVLALELEATLRKAGSDVLVWRGRHEPNADHHEPADAPGACQVHARLAEPLGQAGHAPARYACGSCPAGMAAQVVHFRAKGRDDRADEVQQHLQSRCGSLGWDTKDVVPCGYITQTHDALSSWVVIICQGAFTPGLLRFEEADGTDKLTRTLVVDESTELVNEVIIGVEDLRKLADSCDSLSKIPPPADEKHWLKPAEWLSLANDWRLAAGEVALAKTGAQPSQALLDALTRIAQTARPIMSSGTMPTAKFEEPQLDWRTWHHILPPRATETLAWSVEHGSLSLGDGTIWAAAPSALTIAVVEQGAKLAVLDATPSPTVRELVRVLGGQTVVNTPPQPLDITWHHARSHSRIGLSAKRIDREAKGLERLSAKMTKPGGKPPVILSHLPLVQHLNSHSTQLHKQNLGWWGNDERGHNRWADRDLIIAGLPIPPPWAWAAKWRAHRAILAWVQAKVGTATTQLPAWSDAVAPAGEVEVIPGAKATCHLPLCAVPEIRDWQLEILGASVVQALGRVRALHHPGHRAVIMAPPVPISGAGYGVVQLVEDHDPEGMPQTRAVYCQAKRNDTETRAVEAALQLIRQQGGFSRRTINHVLQVVGLPGLGGDSYQTWFARYGGMSEQDLAEVLAVLLQKGQELVKHGAPPVAHLLGPDELDCYCAEHAAVEILDLVQSEQQQAPDAERAPPVAV